MSPPIRDGSGSSIGSIRLGDGSEISEVRTGAGDVVFSAIPDSVIDNYEDANADPAGPYESGDDLSTYYTITAGSWSRSTTDAIADSKSLARDTASGLTFTDGLVSQPGDGLPNYPEEGGTVSLIVGNATGVATTVMAAVPPGGALQGYGGVYTDSSDYRIFRLDGSGSATELASTASSATLPAEIVIKPPASGESTVEASVWSLNADLTRDTQQDQISATNESTYAGGRGVGVATTSDSGTGTIADNLRLGRGL